MSSRMVKVIKNIPKNVINNNIEYIIPKVRKGVLPETNNNNSINSYEIIRSNYKIITFKGHSQLVNSSYELF